jgi:signal transduction histidine kinase/DNA-binding NarL/FixJ family response regulator
MRILIAEDDPSTRHLLRRLLTDWGYTVLSAIDADEAWAMIVGDEAPHVAILDEGLSKGGGMGMCRLMQSLSARSHMHVIVSMTIVDSPAMIAAFDAGADDLIEKPFDVTELRLRIAAGCDEVRQRLAESGLEDVTIEQPRFPSHAARPFAARAVARAGLGPAAPAIPSAPAERQHAALALLTEALVGGTNLRDFCTLAGHRVVEVVRAERVQILERGADGASWLVRADVGSPPADPEAVRGLTTTAPVAPISAETFAVEIGPGPRTFGQLAVTPMAGHPLSSPAIEFVTSVAHLVGAVAQRERLELQVQQAQKMEIFGRLAGGIAHDFNNVLAVIGTGVSALESRTPADADYREDVELIGQGVERGRLLARRLLRFSRAPSDAPTLIDLNTIIGEGQRMMERILVGKVALATDVALMPLVVRADRGEVEQVLLNLVLNARDAMPSGGLIRVATTSAHPRNAAPDVRYAAISVTDSGIGMDPSTKARMFEPFFTTKPPGLGTGLGLSTVKEIVRRAEGCIEVDSAPGQGTKITVFWPCNVAGDMVATSRAGDGNNQSAA